MKDERKIMDFIKKLFSRKLLVFAIGTTLLLLGRINETTWLYISMIYVGANIAQAILNDAIVPIKNKLNSQSSSSSSSFTTTATTTADITEGEA